MTSAGMYLFRLGLVWLGHFRWENGLTGTSRFRAAAPTLAYFVRTLVGLDRAAAQSAFSDYLADRSLTPQQVRFVEMVIDQLTARGVMEAAALYEPPFSNLHAEGPDELFAGHEAVIEGIFEKLRRVREGVLAMAG